MGQGHLRQLPAAVPGPGPAAAALVRACVRACVRAACLRACVRARVHACASACVRACVLANPCVFSRGMGAADCGSMAGCLWQSAVASPPPRSRAGQGRVSYCSSTAPYLDWDFRRPAARCDVHWVPPPLGLMCVACARRHAQTYRQQRKNGLFVTEVQQLRYPPDQRVRKSGVCAGVPAQAPAPQRPPACRRCAALRSAVLCCTLPRLLLLCGAGAQRGLPRSLLLSTLCQRSAAHP